jgi:plasmid replication initiation protein
MYRLSGTARKLIAMGMAIIPSDMSSLTARFSLFEYCKALDIEPGGETYRIVEDAVLECIQVPITIDTPERWTAFTWIQTAEIDKKTNMITLVFSTGLMKHLHSLKKMYARISLMDIGKLHSIYAIRLYELAKSYESLAGQYGNPAGTWYFERTPEEMRKLLGIGAGEYAKVHDFKRYALERPIMELNISNLGITLKLETVKRGRAIQKFRFFCEKARRTVGSGGKASASGSEGRISETLAEKELDHVAVLYSEEYAEVYQDLVSHPPNQMYRDMPDIWSE